MNRVQGSLVVVSEIKFARPVDGELTNHIGRGAVAHVAVSIM